eukprot:GFUD01006304.1.p1 GENE.GFUD01006304.1~~GFUD01006304.1.p1  ORF type:complete len:481 (-),score=167.66 GFUD01006304.1:83-1525(-)
MEWLRIPATDPGKKKSKVTKSPFYFFMMSKKTEWEAAGQWSERKTMEDLVHEAFPIWKSQQAENPEFMAPFIDMHRKWKMEKLGDLENKYDTLGRPLADIEREMARQRKKVADMEREVEETVMKGKQGRSLSKTLFYVGYFNYLCKTDQGFYIPCEGAVVEFSLEKGISRCWQEFLSPLDSIPKGYQYRCTRFSRVSHNLCPEFEKYATDYEQILSSLMQFLSVGQTDKAILPPIYVMPEHEEAAECITQFMMDKARYRESTQQLRVFSLPLLVLNLYNSSPKHSWPIEYLAQYTMEKDPYSHHYHLGCDFHEALENPTHCALSICKRLVFSLSSECCPAHNLPLRPGRHFPPDQSTLSSLSLEDKREMTRTSHVREEGGRINRFVPAVCGVTTVPDDFDREQVIHGEKGAFYPGLHPELRSTYQTVLQAEVEGKSANYTGNTFYTLDTDSDIGVKMGSSMVASQSSSNQYKTNRSTGRY